ncbi:MAG: Uma2 family endonuclease [Limisphaerales bacterium]
MTASILDMPEVRQRVSPLSVEDYHRLGEFNEKGRRTELIRGIVIEKMSKSPVHSTMVVLLYRLLLARVPKGFTVRQEQPLTLKDSEPEPDIAIVCGTERDFLDAHPGTAQLVIEVALASAALDRENASLYAEACVKEYWIVLGKEHQVEVYRRPENGRYQEQFVAGPHGTIECLGLPGVQIQVSDLLP